MNIDSVNEAGFVHVDTGELKEKDLSSGTYKKSLRDKAIANAPKLLVRFCDDLAIKVIRAYRDADEKAGKLIEASTSGGPARRIMAAIGRPEDPEVAHQITR